MMMDISRTAGNVYEKADKNNWMVVPRYSEVPMTSHVDAGNLVLFHDREKIQTEEIADEYAIEILKSGCR